MTVPSPGAIWPCRLTGTQLALALGTPAAGRTGGRAVLCLRSKLASYAKYGDNFDEWPDDVDDEAKVSRHSQQEIWISADGWYSPLLGSFFPDEYDDDAALLHPTGRLRARFGTCWSGRLSSNGYTFENAATERALRAMVRRERRRDPA